MVYREIPDCPEPDYVPEISVEEEIRRFNRTKKIITVTALFVHLLIVTFIIATC